MDQEATLISRNPCSVHWFRRLVAQGWRPGAVSKGLLRKLTSAKQQKSSTTFQKKLKKTKRRTDDAKPGLIVSKVNGEYRVEMQVIPESSEGNDSQIYSPLIYKIVRPNNEERLMKRERKTRRLVKKVVGNWPDPFHPEYCERTCMRAFNQAVGLAPYDPENPRCTCPELKEEEEECSCCDGDDNDESSDCSSLDVNWEIHFTPPNQMQS